MSQHEILSPLPGTFYRKPAPDADPFVQEGSKIQVGDVIGLVEVMKMFNEVHSDVSGTVLKCLVENEDPVESGQALMLVQP